MDQRGGEGATSQDELIDVLDGDGPRRRWLEPGADGGGGSGEEREG